MADSPVSTPKRKRNQVLIDEIPNLNTGPSHFSFDLRAPVDDGSASPGTKVALKFHGLTLESGGGVRSGGSGSDRSSQPQSPERRSTTSHAVAVTVPADTMHEEDTQGGARKRVKLPDIHMPDADVEANADDNNNGNDVVGMQHPAAADGLAYPGTRLVAPLRSNRPKVNPTTADDILARIKTANHGLTKHRQLSPKAVQFAVDTAVVEQSETLANTGSATNHPSSPTTHKYRKRAGTPPHISKASRPSISSSSSSSPDSDSSDEPTITDPLRASLTWHDDEITIYDPDDSDDDGTGINGIGFKPTPAIAHARTVRRRQQLAEYRKREEREARAKRSLRRRGSPVPGLVELKGKVERRRVRFMESSTQLIGV
ncbi:hypothetical protein B0T22DRAFT_463249 [Podospora appendiculata]|uniref:Uncharacterized protein n=1 Tax=Podospora appendiculata TaxID=314037 RepID=A0AAE0XCN5_9PEZI|nr:hypothetical protein B0T22DRAFT_463249 [Podospora appendiculata]